MRKPIVINGLPDTAILRNIWYIAGLTKQDLGMFNSGELEVLLRLRDEGFLKMIINDDGAKLRLTADGYDYVRRGAEEYKNVRERQKKATQGN